MKSIRSLVISVLCLAAIVSGIVPTMRAQILATYQGSGADSDVGLYDPTTGQLVSTFSLSDTTGVFKVLTNAAASEYFFISNAPGIPSGGMPVLAVGTFSLKNPKLTRPKMFGTFAQPITSAVISGDDQYLIVGEKTVHIFSTSSFADLVPGGITIPNATTVTDLAVDYDSQTVYVLSASPTQSYLSTISLPTLTNTGTTAIGQTVDEPVGSTFITFAPNGLLYISSPSTITEANPLTLAATPSGTLAVPLVNPGRPVFTPSGQYIVAADQSPAADGSAAVLIDLNLHAVAGTLAYNGLAAPITQLTVANDNTVYALVAGVTTLYVLQIGTNGGLILNTPPFAANLAATTNAGSVTDVAAFTTSTDFGVPGRNAPQYLYVVGNGVLGASYIYEIDPVSLAIVNQFPWTGSNFLSAPGGIKYVVPTLTFNAPTTILTYGNNQTIPLSGTTLPIVIRALDQNGLPVAGAGIFAFIDAPATGGSIDSVLTPDQGSPPYTYTASLITDANGYADFFFTAGTLTTDVGRNSISVDGGPSELTFTVNVGTSNPATAAALTIVSGQGQVIFQNPNPNPDPNAGPIVPLFASTPAPLTVMATDNSGNPLSGVTIVFTVLSGPQRFPGASQTQVTDSLGQAAATFPPNTAQGVFAPAFASNGPAAETIAATTGTLDADFYLTTVPYANVTGVGCATPPCITSVPEFNVQVVSPAYGSSFTGSANSTIPNAVKVIVTSLPSLLPIPNVGVSVSTGTSTTTTNARCSEPTGSGIILTDSTGTAVCNLLLNNIPGTAPLSVFIPQQSSGVAGFATLTVTQNPAATINIVTGNDQYGTEGSTLMPFTMQVVDASNTPIPGAALTWQVVSGPLSLSSVTTTADSNGMATATPLAGMTPGVATITVTSGAATATFTATIGAPVGNVVVVSGDNQTVPLNSAVAAPLVIQVLDSMGNPAPFEGILFQVSGTPPLATFPGTTPPGGSSTTVVTDSNGNASVPVMAGAAAGNVTITAEAPDGSASTFFTLTVLSPAPSSVQILNIGSLQPSFSPGSLITITGTNVAPTITGTVTDAATLGTSGYTVTIGGINAPISALINQNGMQQVNAQIPFEVTPGTTSVDIQTPQGASSTPITVNTLSPAFLTNGTVTVNGSTYPQASATRPDGSTVSAANPAKQGEAIRFMVTGLGQTVPTAITGTPGLPGQIVYAPLFAAVNHLGATITSAVYEAGMNGIYQVAIQIPSTTTPGPGQPISLYELDSTGVGYNATDIYLPIAVP